MPFDGLSLDQKRFHLNFHERGNFQLQVTTSAKAKFCIQGNFFSFFFV